MVRRILEVFVCFALAWPTSAQLASQTGVDTGVNTGADTGAEQAEEKPVRVESDNSDLADSDFQSVSLVEQLFTIGQYTFPVSLPEGFTLDIMEVGLEGPRVLHFHKERLFIGSKSGKVYWLDPPYDESNVLVELDDYPHSVVIHNETVFIARTSGVYIAPYRHTDPTLDASEVELLVALPGGRGHNSRTLKRGPDGRLYVSLGISGNCSDQYLHDSYPFDQQRGGVFVFDPGADQPSVKPFASGLRNPVGFDWHPVTGELYATNNGPDHLGYEQPREVFAHLPANSFHGMPWYQHNGQDFLKDPCIDSDSPLPVAEITKPAATFPARIAPMDMVFLDASSSARPYINDAIVALRGSWATETGRGDGDPTTRREPKLVRVEFDKGEIVSVSDFLTGFQLPNGARWTRPVGVAVGPDGNLYFSSDDGIHGLYRVSLDKKP